MSTKLLYLENPYLKSLPAVLTTVEAEGPCSWKVQFDQTIFYPMGGGQPTDQGIVSYPDGTSGEVYQVLCKEGKVFHYVRQACPPRVGESILQTLNWERRFRHMRVHSAGHVIDFALYRLGYSPYPLVPLKGDHGKKPSILYQGHVQDSFQARLQEETQNLIAQNLRFSWSFEPLERL